MLRSLVMRDPLPFRLFWAQALGLTHILYHLVVTSTLLESKERKSYTFP